MSRPFQPAPSRQGQGGQTYNNQPAQDGLANQSNVPPSFKTNVNRAKTKRWVEAKSYSYDGDDWGEVDDYDEYGGYNDPQQSGSQQSHPTGLRQQGQSSIANQAPGRPLAAASSFERGEENRDFSAPVRPPDRQNSPGIRQNSPGPAGQQIQQRPAPNQLVPSSGMQSGPPRGMYGPPQQQRPHQQYGPGQPSGPHPPNDPRRPSFEQSRPMPAGGSPGYPPPGGFRPPQYGSNPGSRTHSMTSNSSHEYQSRRDFSPSAMPPPLSTRGSPAPPNLGDPLRPPRKSSLSQATPPPLDSPNLPAEEVPLPLTRDTSQAPSERSENSQAKPLPFVRPADIYKRMQEERERERKSQESTRPSMQEIMADQPPLPTQETPVYDRTSEEIPRPSESRERRGSETGSESGAPVTKPNLSPIQESKSTFVGDGSLDRPMLPEVSRLSGFGDSIMGAMRIGDPSTDERPKSLSQQISKEVPTSEPKGSALKDQPSLRFRTVVNQAFDRSEGQLPHTPSSASGSNIARTNSESTNGISPIISRVSSTAQNGSQVKEGDVREAGIHGIVEEPGEASPRPMSQDTPVTPKANPRGRSGTQLSQPDSIVGMPISYLPGGIQATGTSDSDNSPAHTAALDTNKALSHPQTAELAMVTPSEPTFDKDTREMRSDHQSVTNATGTTHQQEAGRSREDSPSKGRVHDLAGRFESPERINQDSTNSADAALPRPPGNRFDSFRPQLPGGWDSFASRSGARPDLDRNESSMSILPTPPEFSVGKADPLKHQETQQLEESASPAETSVNEPHVAKEDEAEPPQDPFSRVSAAGTALASAFAAAVGVKGGKSESEDEQEEHVAAPARYSNKDMDYRPEASKPWLTDTDDSASSVAPTPLPKDTPGGDMESSPQSHYFPPVVPLKHKSRASFSDEGELPRLSRPPMIPNMSTETSPHDYESDRLRKQLVRELSPSSEQFDKDARRPSLGPDQSRYSALQTKLGHESMALPKEYDHYWNSVEDETPPSMPVERSVPPMKVGSPRDAQILISPHTPGSLVAPQSSGHLNVQPALKHRFSWEPEPEELNASKQMELENKASEPKYPNHMVEPYHPGFVPAGQDVQIPSQMQTIAEPTDLDISPSHDSHSPMVEPSYSPSATKAESVRPELPKSVTESTLTTVKTTSRMDGPLPPMPAEPIKLPAFREILALKTPAERIHKYNETREQFATMDTGLTTWIAATIAHVPEHSNLTQNGGRYISGVQRPTHTKGKLTGLRIPSSHTTPQPYYQQYLNASASSPTATSFNNPQSPTAQNHSSPVTGSGGKVGVKGKDLLHTAGLFGGKANVAAKGLFSKGRNKLRGSDKAQPVTPSPDRRSGMRTKSNHQPQSGSETSTSSFGNKAPVFSATSPSTVVPTSVYVAETTRSSTEADSPRAPSSSGPRTPSFDDPFVATVEPSPLAKEVVPTNTIESADLAGIQSPVSVTSSNKTPTQSTYRKNSWLTERLPSPAHHNARERSTSFDLAARDKALPLPPPGETSNLAGRDILPPTPATLEFAPNARDQPTSAPVAQSADANIDPASDVTKGPQPEAGVTTRKDRASASQAYIERPSSPRASEDSDGTFQTAGSNAPSLNREQEPLVSRRGLADSLLEAQSKRPFSFLQEGDIEPNLEQKLTRGEALDDETPTIERQNPTSSTDAYQSDSASASSSKGARHYRPSHDFVGPSTRDSLAGKPRPRSFSRPFQNPIGRINLEPESSQKQPSSSPVPEVPPLDATPTAVPKPTEASPLVETHPTHHPDTRGQQPEVVDQPPPAVARPQLLNVEKRKSWRTSRNSGIFKSVGLGSREETPSPPTQSTRQSIDGTPARPFTVEKRSKRERLIRTLTGRPDSSSPTRKGEVTPPVPRIQTDFEKYISTPPLPTTETKSGDDREPTSKHQRSATFGVMSPDGGRKKRFSGLGGLLDRTKRRQSSVPVPASSATWTPPMKQPLPSRAQVQQDEYQPQYRHQSQPPHSMSSTPNQISSSPAPMDVSTQHRHGPSPNGYFPPQQQLQPYTAPAEAYYGPERRSGTFSAEFMSGQRSPRLGAQKQPSYVQDNIPDFSMNAPDQNFSHSFPPRSSSHQPAASHVSNFASPSLGTPYYDADPHPSWQRSQDGQNQPPPSVMSPPLPSQYSTPQTVQSPTSYENGPSFPSSALHQAVLHARGQTAPEAANLAHHSTPPPPAPPPKGEQSPRSPSGGMHPRHPAYRQSLNQPLSDATYNQQNLPNIQANNFATRGAFANTQMPAVPEKGIAPSFKAGTAPTNQPYGYSTGRTAADKFASPNTGYFGQEWHSGYGNFDGE
ncbi:hypothetical protein MMC25_001848 [Agyrium rufum]|nr:hypothetical protein [Agyrium rufum]